MASVGFRPTPAQNFGRATAVVPSDTEDTTANALYVGVAGDITCTPAGQTTSVLFKAVAVGFFPVAVTRVWATGTAATNMLALS